MNCAAKLVILARMLAGASAAALLESFISTVNRERGDRISDEAALPLIAAGTNLLTQLE